MRQSSCRRQFPGVFEGDLLISCHGDEESTESGKIMAWMHGKALPSENGNDSESAWRRERRRGQALLVVLEGHSTVSTAGIVRLAGPRKNMAQLYVAC